MRLLFKFENFKDMSVNRIALAVYVAPSLKPDAHVDRTYQGLVMNEPTGSRVYYFSDGTEMRTEGSEVFFLPKGSTYRVVPTHNNESDAGCYAINFDADIESAPFSLKPRDSERFLKLFAVAADIWKRGDKTANLAVMRTVYDIVLGIEREAQRSYVPRSRETLILPALELIGAKYTEPELSVSTLAAACGISEVYFRRIFKQVYGISPKEYVIRLRIKYAKQLLSSGEFSVTQVASLSGYSEPCHFSREFSRIAGVAPTEFARDG